MSRLHQLVRTVLDTDREAAAAGTGIRRTRCLHCRAHLTAGADGEPLGATTLEHIVPRSWFRRRAAQPLVAGLTGPDDPRNLALACARCNQQKGRGPDADGPASERARAIVARLLETRRERYVPLASWQPGQAF